MEQKQKRLGGRGRRRSVETVNEVCYMIAHGKQNRENIELIIVGKCESSLDFLVPEGRFSGGQKGDSWWDENIVSRNNWNYFEKMAFRLGIKSRFWLLGLVEN